MRPARALLLLASVCLTFSCAGFQAVERGDWQCVWADSGRRGPEAAQLVIPKEKFEEEVAAGTQRAYDGPPGWRAPLLQETERIGLGSGEVAEFTVDESKGVELLAQGSSITLYWNPMKKRDEWKDGTDVTLKESRLWVVGRAPGSAVLRLSGGNTTRDIPVTVTVRAAP
jgi:hypothetical protein